MMNKRKLWCFMQAFSYPLSILGILALIFLAVVTGTPGILVILLVVPAIIIIAFFLFSAINGLLECYEDYRFRIRKD